MHPFRTRWRWSNPRFAELKEREPIPLVIARPPRPRHRNAGVACLQHKDSIRSHLSVHVHGVYYHYGKMTAERNFAGIRHFLEDSDRRAKTVRQGSHRVAEQRSGDEPAATLHACTTTPRQSRVECISAQQPACPAKFVELKLHMMGLPAAAGTCTWRTRCPATPQTLLSACWTGAQYRPAPRSWPACG